MDKQIKFLTFEASVLHSSPEPFQDLERKINAAIKPSDEILHTQQLPATSIGMFNVLFIVRSAGAK